MSIWKLSCQYSSELENKAPQYLLGILSKYPLGFCCVGKTMCLFMFHVPCQLRGMFVFISKRLFCFNWKFQQSLKCEACLQKHLSSISLALPSKEKWSQKLKKRWRTLCGTKLLLCWFHNEKGAFSKHTVQEKNQGEHCICRRSCPLVNNCFRGCYVSLISPPRARDALAGWLLCSSSCLCWDCRRRRKGFRTGCGFLSVFLMFITKCGWQQG